MEYGIYIESSVVDLKPKLLNFLNIIIKKAKEAKDYVISFKKQELAELLGKDVRTTSRYLEELRDKKVIEMKGAKGRAGGTIVKLNAELIKFDTSDKALVNQDVSIEQLLEQKFPKKKPEAPKNKKHNRRTKKQMIEARALQAKKQSEYDKMNKKLKELNGVPNWDWFKETKDPVGNYKTYLITRLYNRYAVVFTRNHNADVKEGLVEGYPVPKVSKNYDVLPFEFYGSVRWAQFEMFRKLCDENGIAPEVYLSAQFNRSIFSCSRHKPGRNSKMLPFVNTLVTENAVDVYKDYCEFHMDHSVAFASHRTVPAQYMDDFVLCELADAYRTADHGVGLVQYRGYVNDFLNGYGADDRVNTLVDFYDNLSEKLRKSNVTFETRDTVKKFVLLQSMMLTGGATNLPLHLILGSETVRIMLISMNHPAKTFEENVMLQGKALGMLTHPELAGDQQLAKGLTYLEQMTMLHETPYVLRLVMERKGLYLSLADIQKAFKEIGKEHIPVDDYSLLDIDQVIAKTKNEEANEQIDIEQITDKKTWTLEGSIGYSDPIENLLPAFTDEK